jgi:thiol-disulfide isomerase/thioredoxin
MRQLAVLALIFALICIAALPAAAEPGLGEKAPQLTGTDLGGNPISLAELNKSGKFVFIDFWAYWCGPCMREIPHVAPFYDEMKGDSFELIGVSLDSPATEEKMHSVIAENGMHYPIIYDIHSYPMITGKQVKFQRGGGWKNRLGVRWGIRSIPATFLVNPDGVIILKNMRGEEGLALVKKIVTDIPDFLPPDIEVSAVLKDGAVRGSADLSKLPFSAHKLVISVAYYQPPAAEGEPGEWMGGDYELTLTPADDGYIAKVTPSPDNEGKLSITIVVADGFLSVTLDVAEGVETAYFDLSYFAPELDAAISVGSTYARAPKEEPAGE